MRQPIRAVQAFRFGKLCRCGWKNHASSDDRGFMKMRDLESRTGINRETIRVYLRHGLVPHPSRPKPNVADYDESHARAIIAVRDLQRDSGLTLKQIKGVLKGQQGPRRVEAGAFQNLELLVAAKVGFNHKPILIASLAKDWPHANADARVLQSIGIVDIIETAAGPALSVTDTRLVTIWGEMRSAGFTEEVGFTPDILAFYLEPSNKVASREAQLFLEHTEGKIDDESAAAMLQIAFKIMLDFFGLLRMKTFMRRIHRDSSTPAPARRGAPPRKTRARRK
jgi:DNA-binding transcriptional MerR regulator